jgi:predicted SAM-dependent methyltransferase
LSKLVEKNVDKYLLDQNATILDIGCGKKPYQPFFLGKSDIYLGVDIRPSEFVDIICSGKKLPFKDHAFSAILCNQVLEHIEEPKMVIDEIYGVLK